MYCSSGRFFLTAAVLAMLASCAHAPATPSLRRIAVLRFENLGSDTSEDWIGRAFPEVITAELAGATAVSALPAARLHALNPALGLRPVSAPGISSEKTMAIAAGAQRLAYGYYTTRNGRVDATLVVENVATGGMPSIVSESEGDVISAATALARHISGKLIPYGVHDARALRGYCLALEANDAASAEQNLQDAIAADPDFARPYLALAQIRLQRQDRAGAVSLLESAAARGDRIGAVERSRVDGELAALRNDFQARRRALSENTRLDPEDSQAWRALGETDLALHDYRGSAQAFQAALAIEPDDFNSWNRLGYVSAYEGDLAGAMTALRRYQALRPAEPNPLDSMGDVNLMLGHLREAEDYYLQSAKKDPSFQNSTSLFKAAMARLLSGDVTGADGIARQYIEARKNAKDLLSGYRAAEWTWLAGRRKTAIQQLEDWGRTSEAGPLREVAARAYAQSAIWRMLLGDREGALPVVQKASALAGSSSAPVAVMARFLALPPAAPTEWNTRLEQMLPNVPPGPAKEMVLVDALLLNGQYAAALPLLQKLHDSASDFSDPLIPVALAWTLIETGRPKDAAPLLRLNPLIESAGPFAAFHFPRLFQLRAAVAKIEGNREEAARNEDLFRKLRGPDPAVGESETKAAAR